MTTRDDEELTTVEAALELGGISDERVCQFIRSGRLPARKRAGRWFVRRGDLELVRDRKGGRPRKDSEG